MAPRRGLLLSVGLLLAVLPWRGSATDNMPTNSSELVGLFPLTIIHTNDLHARFDETTTTSGVCKASDQAAGLCIAGLARVYGTIKKLRSDYANKSPLYLNAGDNFQGSLWYTLLRGNVTADLISALPPKVMTLGNHEFDHSPKELGPYLTKLKKAGVRTVSANILVNNEPDLANVTIPKSTTFTKRGKLIAIIGATYDATAMEAVTGKVRFYNCSEAVANEARRLTERGVKRIIVLSHCGLDVDRIIAKAADKYIDIIVGAHTHSFLFPPNSDRPRDPADVIEDDYPVVVTGSTGRKILITQAYAFGKYVGRLTVYFDRSGEVKFWEGYPIYMSKSVPQDPDTLARLAPWRAEVERLGSQKIGTTTILLSNSNCRLQECTAGSLVADSFAAHYTNATFRPVTFVHAGSFRASIPIGDITNGQAISVNPFGNTVDLIQLPGAAIRNCLEHAMVYDTSRRFNVMQVSGIRYTVNLSNPEYQRITSVSVIDPLDGQYKPLDATKLYDVATISFLMQGLNGFRWMQEGVNRQIGPLDSDLLVAYIAKLGEINAGNLPGGRITISGTAA
ncbi:apyrase-like [Anopheles ziemanni]|uniref:apyrase-like n=1 Tax=Anopheles coustani TaxID=139045 RepID=UPI002659F05A|nr:apyrase-like [Anopheles coustani]XP_058170252.1 apyrase-like [Anopheles ziemanni]